MTTLRVNEIFSSIQGEGYWTGLPVTFLRLQGCNLRCPWCDTEHARDLVGCGVEWKVSALADELRLHTPGTIVVTGGEPMLQVEGLRLLYRELRPRKRFHLETNGTIRLGVGCPADWVTISPKPPDFRIAEYWRPDEIKVVVTSQRDIGIAIDLATAYPIANMCLQPEGNKKDLLGVCIRALLAHSNPHQRWRLSVQLHKLIGVR